MRTGSAVAGNGEAVPVVVDRELRLVLGDTVRDKQPNLATGFSLNPSVQLLNLH